MISLLTFFLAPLFFMSTAAVGALVLLGLTKAMVDLALIPIGAMVTVAKFFLVTVVLPLGVLMLLPMIAGIGVFLVLPVMFVSAAVCTLVAILA